MNYQIHTFGCKVNTYDSSLLEKRFTAAGWEASSVKNNDDSPRVHVLNTCAVTEEASKEAKRTIRRLKVKDPFCKIIVTGCAAQVDTQFFTDLSGVDLIVANSHKGDLENLVEKMNKGLLTEKVYKSNIFKKADLEEGGGVVSSKTRAFVKIQDGCNSFCTFCVIPFARGKSRSLSVSYIINKINELSLKGINEAILTGVHIGDYYDESSKSNLEDLVEAVLLKTKMPRIRLTSLEPIELSSRLLDLYADKRLCPHFHMSIQSAQTKVLKDMKRKYDARSVELALNAIQKHIPNAFVGMDVIVGFPGETEQEYQETYDRLASLPWSQIHVFPYSPRPGVYANKLDGQWDRSLIMQRAKNLRQLSHDRYAEMAFKQVGLEKELLLLNSKNNKTYGLTQDYWKVEIETDQSLNQGHVYKVKVKEANEPSLLKGSLLGPVTL